MEQAPAHGHGSLAARKVSIRTPLADVETFEKETATFHLELSHPGVAGVWTRDGIRVKPSSTCRISATGCGHSLTLERLALEDSGTVTFAADPLRCSARLLVRGTVTGAGSGGAWHRRCPSCSCSVPGETAGPSSATPGTRWQMSLCPQGREVSSAVGTPPPGCGSGGSWDTSDECLTMAVPQEVPPSPLAEMSPAQLPIPTAPSPCLCPTKPSCPVSSPLRASSHNGEGPTGPGGPGDRGGQLRVRAVSPQRGGEVVQGEGLPQSPPAAPSCALLPALPPDRCPPCRGCGQGKGLRSSGVLPARTPERTLPGQDGQELWPGPNCRFYSAGRRRVLQLSRCEPADAGVYTCDAGDCRASATLHVQGTAVPLLRGTRTPKPAPPALPCPCPPWHPAPCLQSAGSASCRTCRTPRRGRETMPSSPARRRTTTSRASGSGMGRKSRSLAR